MSGMFDDDDELDDMESPLALEFETLCEDVRKQIDAKCDEARKALKEAVALSEQYGVPFSRGISFLSNSYIPTSFKSTKFAALSRDTICEIANVHGEYIADVIEYGGWVHSAVC